MLSLMDPLNVEGAALYRDDEDPRTFYLLPDEPVIPVDEAGLPDFYFISFIRDQSTVADTAAAASAAGGYVQFRTVLTVSPDRRQRIVAGLRAMLVADQQSGTKRLGMTITATDPILADPLWISGTVNLETFKVGDNEMVRQATTSAPVDLAGALGASLDVQLDAEGADVFWGAFQSFDERPVPILVSYQLAFKAHVAAHMEIHADRNTVVQQIWKMADPAPHRWDHLRLCWIPLAFTRPFLPEMLPALQQTDPTVDALAQWQKVKEAIHSSVTTGAVTVNISTDEAGTAADGSDKVQEMLLNVASEVLSGKVIPALFGDGGAAPQPTGDPTTPGMTMPTDDTQLVRMPPVGSSDTTDARFDIVLSSSSTITQACNPNGPIRVLLKTPELLKACFKQLRLADGFFAVKRVSVVTAGINFATDGISVVHVYLEYDQIDESDPGKQRVYRTFDGDLRSETDTLHWKFDMARDAGGAHKQSYRFRADVYYGELVIRSTVHDWVVRDDDQLNINPGAMGAVRVQLALTADRDVVKSARVTMRYAPPQGGTLEDSFELTPDARTKTWFKATGMLVAPGSAPPQYTCQVTYRVGAGEIAMPEVASSADHQELPGPFTRTLSWHLAPQGSFDGVRNLSGQATYSDPVHEYEVIKTFSFDSLAASKDLDVPVLEGAPTTLTVTASLNHTDGSTTPLPPLTAPPGLVSVGVLIESFLTITVIPDGLDFDKDVQLAVVMVSYQDPDAHKNLSTTFTFSKASKAMQTWKVPVSADSPLGYTLDIEYLTYDRTKISRVHQVVANTDLSPFPVMLDHSTPPPVAPATPTH